ncbi:hypothetical protein Tco_1210512 [Tanacetum coccineum]
MDDPNITMEEYIRLEEEKARRRGKVFNWETAKYGKIRIDEDVHNLRSVKTKFPAITLIDEISSENTFSCELTVSSLNKEVDFRILFDDSDDDDHAVIFVKNSFSYKIIYINNLKTDSENDNEKVNMPFLPPPEPTVCFFDDLDFFKDFENEFPAIVYNNAQTSKSDLLTEPILSPEHVDEFDLNDETSLLEYDEEEQNILGQDMAPLPPCDKRHLCLRYQVEGYTEEIVHDFKQRLKTIFGFGREDEEGIHWGRWVGGICESRLEEIVWDPSTFTLGLHTAEEMTEDGFGAYWLGSERLVPDKGDLSDYWVEISSGRDFLRCAPSYTYIRDPVQRMCHRLISYSISGRGQAPKKVTATDLFYLRSMDRGAANISYLLAQYLFRHVEGRKSSARLSGGHFIRRIAHHFGLVSDDGLRGLSVMACELSLVDMDELVKLNICMEIGDDWAWVAPGPERQQVATVSAPRAAKNVHVVDEGVQADPTPIQAP